MLNSCASYCTGILPSNVWSYSGSTGTLAPSHNLPIDVFIQLYMSCTVHVHVHALFVHWYTCRYLADKCTGSTEYINVPYCILIRFDSPCPLPLPPEDSDWSKVVPVETSWPSLPGSTLNPHDTLESVLGRLGLLDYYTLLQVKDTVLVLVYFTVQYV